MKRIWILLLALVMVIGGSGIGLAQSVKTVAEPVTGPTWKYGEGIFEDYVFFGDGEEEWNYGFWTEFTIWEEGKDQFPGFKVIENAVIGGKDMLENLAEDQILGVTIKTRANLPCYIEMTLIGNGGRFEGWSFGPNQGEIRNATEEDHWMLFDPAYGGFVDSNWESVNPTNAELLMSSSDLFIQACDLWKAEMFGNVPYKLNVMAAPLNNINGPGTLPLHMRHNVSSSWSAGYVFNQSTDRQVAQFAANTSNEVYMQFRVPFSGQVAGEYEGTVTFKMMSI